MKRFASLFAVVAIMLALAFPPWLRLLRLRSGIRKFMRR